MEVENYNVATTTQSSGVFAALENLLKRNPVVVNMSFGAPKCSAIFAIRRDLLGLEECYKKDTDFMDASEVYTKIFNAPENQDTLFIAAAGNWDIDTRLNVLPATIRLPNLITVGATDLDDQRATFIPMPLLGAKSNFGSDLHISAPGVNVYAPIPDNKYTNDFRGTSASAPMVTGMRPGAVGGPTAKSPGGHPSARRPPHGAHRRSSHGAGLYQPVLERPPGGPGSIRNTVHRRL